MSSGANADEFGPLPPGWVTQVSRSTGNRYWFNTKTGESRYTRPVPIPTGATTNFAQQPQQHGHGAAALPPNSYQQYPVAQLHGAGGGDQPDAKRFRPDQAPPPYQPAVSASDVQPAWPQQQHASIPAPVPIVNNRSSNSSDDVATALAVASAYDHLADVGVAGRKQSSILHLKNFNNWVKAVLISEYSPKPCARVLDLACGKLGDLAKWRLAGANTYCGVDISRTAVDDARQRLNDSNARAQRSGGAISAKLARADLGVTDLSSAGILRHDEQFDALSIQFALHYLFQSEARALTFFRNIAGRLAPGGVFVGTIPDAAYLVRRLRDCVPVEVKKEGAADASSSTSAASSSSDGAPASTTPSPLLPSRPVSFGNSIFNVTFPPESIARQYALGHNPFGVKYTFYLAESVEHIDEYLVPWPLLERLAASAGLVPVASDNFHDFFRRMIGQPKHRATARNMRVMNCEGGMSPEEWEAAGVYRVFAFRRPLPGEALQPDPSLAAQLPPMASLLPPHKQQQHAQGAPAPLPYATHIGPGDILDTIGV